MLVFRGEPRSALVAPLTGAALAAAACLPAATAAQGLPRPPDAEIQALRASALDPARQARRAEAIAAERLRRGDRLGAAAALDHVAFSAARSGNQALWEGAAERELALCTAAADALCRARAENALALADANAGRMESALGRLRTVITLFDRAGLSRQAVMTRLNAAMVRFELGDNAGALADLDAIEPAFREGEGRVHLPHLLMSRAHVLLELGRPRDARDTLRQVLAMGDQALGAVPQLVSGGVEARSLLGRAEAGLRDAAASGRAHRDALALAARTGSPDDRFWAGFRHAESLAELGRTAEALAAIRAVDPDAGSLKPTDRRRYFERSAALHAQAGRIAEAVEAQRRAAELQDRIYRANLVGGLGRAQKDVLVAEREAEARRVTALAARERERAARELLQTRALAVLIALALLAAAAALFLWFRIREQRRRHEQVLAERTRVAGEIHDTLMQGFTGVVQRLHLARRAAGDGAAAAAIERATRDARRALGEARTAVWDLRDHRAAAEPIAMRLRAMARDLGGEDAPEITVDAADLGDLDPDGSATLAKVAREAIANAVRHAGADHIRVALNRSGGRVRLEVADDGRGFEPPSGDGAGRDGHWGLVGMRERVERLGGVFTIDSAPGGGTRVAAELPA